jgi:hypothetical protein
MMMRLMMALGLAALCFGCGKDAPKTDAKKGDTAPASGKSAASKAPKTAPKTEAAKPAAKPAGGNALWAGVDLAAEMKRLEGKWTVKPSFGKGMDTWEVKGDAVTITTAKGETKLGKLKLDMPGRVGIKEPNMTTYYSYARNGDTVYLGLGKAGVKAGDTYIVGTNRGLVRYDGTACTYHEKKMSFGDKPVEFKAAKPVKCSVQAAGDKSLFHYQVPKFMKDGEFDDKSIHVVGTALLDQQMQGNEAKKAQ